MIEAGPHNAAARLQRNEGPVDGPVVLHFRSEAAHLTEPSAANGEGDLVLHGQIAQSSYPGGFWRYAIRVGDRQFMVDDERRLPVGANVGIRLQTDSVHVYPATGD